MIACLAKSCADKGVPGTPEGLLVVPELCCAALEIAVRDLLGHQLDLLPVAPPALNAGLLEARAAGWARQGARLPRPQSLNRSRVRWHRRREPSCQHLVLTLVW